MELLVDVLPQRDERGIRIVYYRLDGRSHGACPSQSFQSFADVERHLRSLGFADWWIEQAARKIAAGETFTLRANWRDEFSTLLAA
jgi:hypothetical protein